MKRMVIFGLLVAACFSVSCATHSSPVNSMSKPVVDREAIRLRHLAMERFAYLAHNSARSEIYLHSNSTLLGYARRAEEYRTSLKLIDEDIRWQQEREHLMSKPVPVVEMNPAQVATDKLCSIASHETAFSLIMQADRRLDSSGQLEVIDRLQAIFAAQKRYKILHGGYSCGLQSLIKDAVIVDDVLRAGGVNGGYKFSIGCEPLMRSPKGKPVTRFQAVAALNGRAFCVDEIGDVYVYAGTDPAGCFQARDKIPDLF